MNEQKQCLFCVKPASYYGLGPLDNLFRVECPNCGTYTVSDRIAGHNPKEYIQNIHLVSGLIREKNDLGLKMETITTENINNLISDPIIPKTIMEKLDKILLHYYRSLKTLGDRIVVDVNVPYAIGYSVNNQEFYHLIIALIKYGFFSHSNQTSQEFTLTSITIEGVKRAEQLLSTNISSNKVFVAMGFRPDLLEAYEKAIKPACEVCKFNSGLVIETEHNDDITDRIIAEIKTSKFMITDFTYNNQGAYFEAGYAQGRGLTVIRTCKKDWFEEMDDSGNKKNHLHFDINHYNFILWEDHDDLKEKLINRIKATIL